MQNQKRNPFFIPLQISSTKIAFWIGFSILLLLPLLSFYPWKYRIAFTVLMFVFVLIDLFSPLVATAILASTGVLFGNHPGGRFLELQDSFWIYWSLRGIIELKFSGTSVFSLEFWKRPIGILLLCFFASGIVSLLANPELVSDIRFYQKGWFWFLHSTELEPWYPIKLLGIGILFWIGLHARREWLGETRKPDRLLYFFAVGIVIGLSISVFVGWMEYFFPFAKSKLDAYHFWLDGYKLIALPHSYFSWMEDLQNQFAIQSLFWNRSWFAVYLISGLPFLFYVLFQNKDDSFADDRSDTNSKTFKSKNRIRLFLLLGAFIVLSLTFVWIGARGGMLSFLVLWISAGVYFLFFRLVKKESIQKGAIRFGIVFLILCGIGFPILVIYTKLGAGDPERLSHFLGGWKLFLSKPLFGGGFESYGWYNECCLTQSGKESPYHTTHNQWIQIFSGLGIFGAFFYALLWGFLLDSIAFAKKENKESIGARALYFGSVVAIFIYSFFQEWFYLRAVYLQWIALFAYFGARNSLWENVVFRIFQKKNVLKFLFSLAILLFFSLYLFPTKMFRSGVYFPPGGDKFTAWILEGHSRIVLVSKPDIYSVGFNSDFPNGISKIDIEGGYRQIYPFLKTMIPKDDIDFRTIEGDNILKFECSISEQNSGWKQIFFWSPEVLDPEPRKLCGQITIRKSLL
ncbi:hypothetical protein A0128_12375 [Leptospira tipperaryensis]|uniref:O-antigen ligase-related domain-containing protein n=1 Tax=Leptospira tipperaryensis TaxID=2564040 RepID=A0A1D7UYA1_9LEPT|nr:O-antigen ligase family protein [Leptospira tipperaryensis]AOP34576.1 hypothetical protein A0128_12375 [Leptospira tipperaryensis]